MRLDVLFVCDAHADTGLGHGSRCAHLARIIMQRNPQTEMAFQGTFSDGAKDFMSKLAPGVPFLAPEQGVAARTSFVDRMADTQDAEAWSEEVVARMMKTCGRVVYMVSGVTLPPVPKGVICIGYQPSDVVSAPPHVLWGLEYAPTHKEVDDDRERDVPREQCRVLLALGGARDDKALLLVLAALSSIEIITDIDLLGTPVNAPMASDYPLGQHQNLHRHENGEQLPYLLKRSGMVIASFGNLGYEALAAGAPLCLIGQKQLQADLAGLFQKCGLAISAGLAANSSKETIVCAVRKTLDEADMLSQTAKRMIDGQGLYRIADIIAPTRGGA